VRLDVPRHARLRLFNIIPIFPGYGVRHGGAIRGQIARVDTSRGEVSRMGKGDMPYAR